MVGISHAEESQCRHDEDAKPHGYREARQLLLTQSEVIESPESRLRYRIGPLLGQGGIGQVYCPLASVGRRRVVVCIKVSERIDGWLREAYFGLLLGNHPRAIRVYDSFPHDE